MYDEQNKNQKAYEWKTIPKFVYKDLNGNWQNFELFLASAKIIDPIQSYQNINNTAKIPMKLEDKEILTRYILLNTNIKEFLTQQNGNAFIYQSISGISDKNLELFENIWDRLTDQDELTQIVDTINHEFDDFKNLYEKRLKDIIDIEKLTPVVYTPFNREKIVKEYICSENIIGNIYNLLNDCILNDIVYLAVAEKFYKILKGYQYENIEVPDNNMTLFLFSKYGKIDITQNKDSRFIISITLNIKESDEKILNDICFTLNIPREEISLQKEKLNGIFMFPNFQISNIIWSDIVMNNPIVSKKIVIDEHLQATKIRKGFYMYHFSQNSSDSEEKTTLTIRSDEQIGSIRVRILNALNMDIVQEIQQDLSIFLSLYEKIGPNIAKEYNKLLQQPHRVEYIKPHIYTKLDYNLPLKKIAPEIFLPNYTISCLKRPKIISDEDAIEKEEKENVQIMRFPKDSEELKQYNFSCEHHGKDDDEKKFIYPGLRTNKEKNKDIYPIVPCCYEVDQRKKKKSLYNTYYNNMDTKLSDLVDIDKDKEGQYRFLISNKFLSVDQEGECPQIIDSLFLLFSESQKPFRKGVHRNTLSFLECICVALNIQNFNKQNSKKKSNIIKNELENLKQQHKGIYAQECWDWLPNTSEFIDSIDIYFDPRRYITLLETYYKCRIVLIGREDFIQPNHIQGYLRWKNIHNPIICIYEHFGSRSDHATYPQCELIQLKNHNDIAYEGVYQTYLESLQTVYSSPEKSTIFEKEDLINILLENGLEIIGQYIDFYGKLFALLVNFKQTKNKLTLFCENFRLPPLDLPIETEIFYGSFQTEKIIRNKHIYTIGEYNFYSLSTQIDETSYFSKFQYTQEQVKLLIENTKFILAKKLINDPDMTDKDIEDYLHNIIKINTPIKYSNKLFSSSRFIYVPNEETKLRLILDIQIFLKRNPSAIYLYPNLQTIPRILTNIGSFETQENSIVLDTNYIVDWYDDFYSLLDSEIAWETIFFCSIANKIYRCIPTEGIKTDWKGYTVISPQNKKIFKINGSETDQHLILFIKKSDDHSIHWYNVLEMNYLV